MKGEGNKDRTFEKWTHSLGQTATSMLPVQGKGLTYRCRRNQSDYVRAQMGSQMWCRIGEKVARLLAVEVERASKRYVESTEPKCEGNAETQKGLMPKLPQTPTPTDCTKYHVTVQYSMYVVALT